MADEIKKIEPITQGVIKKKGIMEVFKTEDWPSIKEYIWKDVISPNIKRSIDEIVTNTTKMILYKGNPPRNMPYGTSKIQYGSFFGNGAPNFSSAPQSSNSKDKNQTVNDKFKMSVYSYDNIVIPTKGEAEAVLVKLEELIEVYGKATVSDLYDAVGISGNYTDRNYGWTNLASADTERAYGGYMLVLPKAKPLQ